MSEGEFWRACRSPPETPIFQFVICDDAEVVAVQRPEWPWCFVLGAAGSIMDRLGTRLGVISVPARPVARYLPASGDRPPYHRAPYVRSAKGGFNRTYAAEHLKVLAATIVHLRRRRSVSKRTCRHSGITTVFSLEADHSMGGLALPMD